MSNNEERYQKNAEIIKKYMTNEIKGVLKNTGNFIRENLPTLEMGYQLIVGPAEEERSFCQMELILECAKKLAPDYSNLEEVIENNFKEYMKNDNLGFNIRKRHKNYNETSEIIKDMFRNHVISIYELLKGEGETYDDLTLSVSPNYEDGLKYVQNEIELSNKASEIVRKDRGIINAPGMFRYDIMMGILNLVEYGNKRLMEELNRIYNIE